MSVLDEIQPEWDALRAAVKELAEIADMQTAEAKRLRRENAELRDEIDHLLIKRQHTEDVNTKLRELAQRLLTEYRYIRVRPRRMYLEHEARMRAIEDEMRELGIEVPS